LTSPMRKKSNAKTVHDDILSHEKNPYQRLANAVVMQAVIDYRIALRENRPIVTQKCEKFFRSKWFRQLVGFNGTTLMNRLRKEYEDECNAYSANPQPNSNDC
jgi:hypothetical protein